MVARYNPRIDKGLTLSQVENRIRDNLVNIDTTIPTKTIKQIIAGNCFTLFNFLNLGLALTVFLVGSYKNLLFLGVVFCNTIISTFQEINAKKTIDKLSLLSATKAQVLRDGKTEFINIDEIVLDDIIDFELGDQVVVDSIILSGECDVNESFITGESKPIHKKVGDMVLSGSFIVSGQIRCQVEHIGIDNYTSKISKDAKYIKKLNSQIMVSLNKIIKTVSIVIVPLGILLFLKQYYIVDSSLQEAVISTVAALIGMIPEGLILLTSTVLAVSVIRLSEQKVLVQELYCIETLARVDTLCLDKTGTITEGTLEVEDIVPLNHYSNLDMERALSMITTNLKDHNPTYYAVQEKYHEPIKKEVVTSYFFSSDRKYSGVSIEKEGTYLLGAPEYLLQGTALKNLNLKAYNEDYRVLLLCYSKVVSKTEEKPALLEAMGLLLITDKIRPTAASTLAYFDKQGVDLKIISGDNPVTVASIAKKAGLKNISAVDATTLTTKEQISEAVIKHNVFGRVSPLQKKEFILSLKQQGHTVAMTGDGVNDCLALKEADCSVAMASGSDAARNVSQLVLLDSNFDSMPKVVLEGRRTINNIERSATLFLVKTIYASLLAIIFLIINYPYPFEPIQLTLTSVVTIGIPAFILALEPNKNRIRGHFLLNVIGRAIPSALTIVLNIIVITILGSLIKLNPDQLSTLCVCMTAYTGFILLYNISKPFNWIRRVLFVGMITIFLIGILLLRTFFSLTLLTTNMLIMLAILMLISVVIYQYMSKFTRYFIAKYRTKILY